MEYVDFLESGVNWDNDICNAHNCNRPVAPGKFFCNRHLHSSKSHKELTGLGRTSATCGFWMTALFLLIVL